METFKVFGKLKRKELSFGVNDVRGVNKREDRLLKSALGSLEKQRIRSLTSIQNEVDDLHITLKETNNVWEGDRHLIQEQVDIQAPKCRTPTISDKRVERSEMIEKQSNIKDNLERTSNKKEISEPTKQSTIRAPESSLQHVNTSNLMNTTKTRDERILNRPRNTSTGNGVNTTSTGNGVNTTSTGSIPKNCHQETTHAALDLRKSASNSVVHKLVSRSSTDITPTGATTLISDDAEQDKIFFKRRSHYQKSASTENITVREKLPTAPFFRPQIRPKKISADFGSLSTISSLSSNYPIRTRKFGTARSLNSLASANVEFSPIPTRRATLTEKRMSRSAVGHRPVTRMISCPQLNLNQNGTNDYCTLSSMNGERSLSRMSTELPELMAVHKMADDKRDETEHHDYRCVSPNNLERTMDKNLQNRINAFLNSLTENERHETGCDEEAV